MRSAVAMSDEEEKLTPVKAFLKHLNLGQHRDVMKTLGYDDPVRVSICPHLGLHLGLHKCGHGPR